MAIEHLTNTVLQNYLDGNLNDEQQLRALQHLNTCSPCQQELSSFKKIFNALNEKIEVQLSPDFTNNVIHKISFERKSKIFSTWAVIFLGILSSVIVIVRYVNLSTVIPSLSGYEKSFHIIITSFQTLKNLLTSVNLNFNLIIFAGLILAALAVIDNFIFQKKWNILSNLI
jgi:hypothetical protein